jgi:hypothetical protein
MCVWWKPSNSIIYYNITINVNYLFKDLNLNVSSGSILMSAQL